MSHAELAKTIDDAFEKRDSIGPGTKGAVRDSVLDRPRPARPRRRAHHRRGANGDWRVNQWLKKAVLLSFRLDGRNNRDSGRSRRGGVAGQSPLQVRRLGIARTLQGGRLARSSQLRGAPLGLHRARRGADAKLRQSRCLCELRHHGGIPGRPSVPARRSARIPTSPAAPASAACWNRCRPVRSSSRTTASWARVPKSPKA